MEIFRYAKDVFGQKMLVGMSWDFLWVPVALAAIVIAAHLVLRTRRSSR